MLKVNTQSKSYRRGKFLFDSTEAIAKAMHDSKTSKSALAKKLGRHKSFVTRILTGSHNMTLATFADVMFALRHYPYIDGHMKQKKGWELT